MKKMMRWCAALGVAGLASMSGASVVTQWNLIVLGNLNNSSQDIEGNAWVGGNFTGGSPTVAKNLTPASNFLGQTTLAVAGNVSVGNLNMQAGNLRYGGSFSGNFNANGGGNRAQQASLVSQVAGFAADLNGLSGFYKNLAANSTVTAPNGQPGAVTYNANPVNGLAVFNVAANSVFNSNLIQQINLNINGASAIVINVSGTTVNFTNGNMVGSWTSAFARSKVIWNFHEATNIFLDRNFNGAILAPKAHLRNTTAIDGSVFVNTMQQDGEVHLPMFTGIIPAPGTLGALAVAGLFAARRRR